MLVASCPIAINNNSKHVASSPTSCKPNEMVYCDVVSASSPSTTASAATAAVRPLSPSSLRRRTTAAAAAASSSPQPPPPPAAVTSRCLGLSLGGASSSRGDATPLPIATVAATRSELRTWRITPTGLVATMGAFLDKPKTNKENSSGAGQGLRYAISSMQGWRVDMEDAHVTQLSMGDEEPYSRWSFFAVFDGHAGHVAAEYAASIVIESLKQAEPVKQAAALAKDGVLCDEACRLLEKGLKDGFLALDEKIRIKLDAVLGKDKSGCTAVCAIVTPSHIVLANLGDSRAVLARQEMNAFGTDDHKPSNEKERQRIIDAGGSVMIQRINGSLAVSRALGDFEYKSNANMSAARQQVSAEPDVYVIGRQATDEYLILACDGIYDVMSNDELCEFVKSRLEVTKDGALGTVCNQVLDACLQKGSRDNMTFLLVCFDAAPSLHEARAAEDERQIAGIRNALVEIIEESLSNGDTKEDLCVEYVLRTLNSTRPEAVPHDGNIRLLVRSIAESVLAEDERCATDDSPESSDEAAAASSTCSSSSHIPAL